MMALGAAPLLALPENLLSLPLMKFDPATAFTAVLLAKKSLLVRATVAPATDALAPILLFSNTLLAAFITAPPAVAATPVPLANICELLTVAVPAAAS